MFMTKWWLANKNSMQKKPKNKAVNCHQRLSHTSTFWFLFSSTRNIISSIKRHFAVYPPWRWFGDSQTYILYDLSIDTFETILNKLWSRKLKSFLRNIKSEWISQKFLHHFTKLIWPTKICWGKFWQEGFFLIHF